MSRPRRGIPVTLALLLCGWAAARAPAADAPPGGVPVEVLRADGTKVSGTFPAATVHVETAEFGSDIPVAKLKQLSLTRDDKGVTATATLTSGTTLEGGFAGDAVTVTVDGKPVTLSAGTDAQQVTFLHPKHWTWLGAVIGLVTLAAMEIVLGVDNIIVLALLSNKLPRPQRAKARRYGLGAALATRLGLLFGISWLIGLTWPLFELPDLPFFHTVEERGVSGRDLVLMVGGLFLIYKSVKEMHEKVEEVKEGGEPAAADLAVKAGRGRFWSVIAQIALIDIVFSLDSVFTAVGMVDELWIMIGGMLIAMGVMLVASGPIARFVERYPTVKVLALSFLVLIGLLLVAESLGQHFNKGYIYFAMGFGVAVEATNIWLRRTGAVPPAAAG